MQMKYEKFLFMLQFFSPIYTMYTNYFHQTMFLRKIAFVLLYALYLKAQYNVIVPILLSSITNLDI